MKRIHKRPSSIEGYLKIYKWMEANRARIADEKLNPTQLGKLISEELGLPTPIGVSTIGRIAKECDIDLSFGGGGRSAGALQKEIAELKERVDNISDDLSDMKMGMVHMSSFLHKKFGDEFKNHIANYKDNEVIIVKH